MGLIASTYAYRDTRDVLKEWGNPKMVLCLWGTGGSTRHIITCPAVSQISNLTVVSSKHTVCVKNAAENNKVGTRWMVPC